MSEKSSVDLELHFHHETETSFKVSEDGDEDDGFVWLPKSQTAVDETNLVEGKVYTFTLPEWLAMNRGLI